MSRLFAMLLRGMGMLIMLVCLNACNNRRHTVKRGFYYWKTNFALTGYEQSRLNDLHFQSLYLHCFDVDWDEQTSLPKPLATVRIKEKPAAGTCIPVVFITQQVVKNIKERQTPQLAADIARLLEQLMVQSQIHPQEIQIDCDWSFTTQKNYFFLLECLKKQPFFSGKKLSCTIRLHQVKYRLKNGIPPVDRGLLMCYNTGSLRQPGVHNSILDVTLVKDYLKQVSSYPLPLDVALPLFRWCLQFRDGKILGILRDVQPDNLAKAPFLEKQKGNLYRCTADTVWAGYTLRAGDEVRAEIPLAKDILNIAEYTAKEINNDTLSVLLFHADSVTLSKYSHDELEAIYNAYR